MTAELAVTAALVALAVLTWPTGWEGDARGDGGAGGSRSETSDHTTIEDAAAALGLVAAALRSGTGALEALEAVARTVGGPAGADLAVVAAAHRWGEPSERAWARVGPGWRAAAVAWHAADTAGAAPAGLLASAANRMREEEARRVESAVQRAGVLLVLPLGACFLPGFIATTVAPVVLLLLGGLEP